eukprot:scaffold16107_cov67-Phaeocystis_antarctica.AAC.9
MGSGPTCTSRTPPAAVVATSLRGAEAPSEGLLLPSWGLVPPSRDLTAATRAPRRSSGACGCLSPLELTEARWVFSMPARADKL